MTTILALKTKLQELGIPRSLDFIRKLEKAGLVFTHRQAKGKYRQLTEEEYHNSVRCLLQYCYHFSIEEIKENNPEVIKNRVKKIKKALKLIA